MQSAQCRGGRRDQRHVLRMERRLRQARLRVGHELVDDAVAVEEDRCPHLALIDSQWPCLIASTGCDDQCMPDESLERFDERRPEVCWRLDDHRDVGELGQRFAGSADDAKDRGSGLARELHRVDEVDGHVVLT